MPDPLKERWYAHPDDLIGGWAILTRDYPPSQLNPNKDPDARHIGDFLSEEMARHIARLHNWSICERVGLHNCEGEWLNHDRGGRG